MIGSAIEYCPSVKWHLILNIHFLYNDILRICDLPS